jgi:hypothetical protein
VSWAIDESGLRDGSWASDLRLSSAHAAIPHASRPQEAGSRGTGSSRLWKPEELCLASGLKVQTSRHEIHRPPSLIGCGRCPSMARDAKLRVQWIPLINKSAQLLLPVGLRALASLGRSVTSIESWPTKRRSPNLCRTCNLPIDPLALPVRLMMGRRPFPLMSNSVQS